MSVITSDRRTLVVGLGKTGLSCVRYLHAQGRDVAVADNRSEPPGLAELKANWPDVPVTLGPFDGEMFSRFNELVVSPGVTIAEPAIQQAVAKGARISGDIDLFSEAASAPIVAITGSNGKTTVTSLVADMALAAGVRVAVGGNIGTPALDLLDPEIELYVLELSSFQLETTETLGALAATVLNVSDDHMDRYPGRMAYFQAKQRIFNGCRNAVVNLDDALSIPMERDNLRFVCYGMNRVNPDTFSTRDDEGGTWITYGFENLIRAESLSLLGRHNLSNVMAALALGKVAGLPMDTMLDVAVRFRGLPHRCQWIRTLAEVEYINDSKGTNVGATVSAIESLAPVDGQLILIAGGEGKGADFQPLAEPAARHCRAIILMGQDAALLASALGGHPGVCFASGLDDAVQQAANRAQPGDRVLLSPACASFDMFQNYEDRGRQFVTAVEALV